MNAEVDAERVAALLRAGQQAEAAQAAQLLEQEALESPEVADQLVRAYAARLQTGLQLLGVFAGSLVEHGRDAMPLGEAVKAQFEKLPLGDAGPPPGIAELSAAATAAWTRDVQSRRWAHQHQPLRQALERWASFVPACSELVTLLDALEGEAMLVWFPELHEAWQVSAEGCVTISQFSLLIAASLTEPLRRAGSTTVAADDPRVLAAARGETSSASFSCDFHVFTWEATDPSDGLPKTGRAVWHAPGGHGAHSLPRDFLVAELPALAGRRIAVVAGPRAAPVKLTRMLPCGPMFRGLGATLKDVARLDPTATASFERELLLAAKAWVPNESDAEFLEMSRDAMRVGVSAPAFKRPLPPRPAVPRWIIWGGLGALGVAAALAVALARS